jgi:hypothetical protein
MHADTIFDLVLENQFAMRPQRGTSYQNLGFISNYSDEQGYMLSCQVVARLWTDDHGGPQLGVLNLWLNNNVVWA